MTSQYKALGSVMPREYLFQDRSPLVTFELHFFRRLSIKGHADWTDPEITKKALHHLHLL